MSNSTSDLIETAADEKPIMETAPPPEPFEVGEKVQVKGRGPGVVHQVLGNGDVLEVAIPVTIYVTVSKDIVTRGN